MDRDKFAAVLEAAGMSEAERPEYCDARGQCVQQLVGWREACEAASDWAVECRQQQRTSDRDVRRRVQKVEGELTQKNAALAETVALLTLLTLLTRSKKARAVWGEGEYA